MADPIDMVDGYKEYMGCLVPGRIKMTEQVLDFKNVRTGIIDHIPVSDIKTVQWVRMARGPALRLLLNTGSLYRFGGFLDSDFERVKVFVKKQWHKELTAKEPAIKGGNWGAAKFKGKNLTFQVDDQDCFEFSLENVCNSTVNKNEVALEFHQSDDAPISLMEMRFYIPTSDNVETDAVEEFQNNVLAHAGVIEATGQPMAVLNEIYCCTPRGRYDIKFYPALIQLHGKTYDYKLHLPSILRLFLLPHKDGRRMYFVISLDPPLKQGQTRYPFLILEFNKDDETEVPPIPEHSGTHAISCAYKSGAGFLYPLERGFIFVHKPTIHIRFDEIADVNFARSDVSTRSFDFEIELKSGVTHTFTSIEKEEYSKLYDFVNEKKLRVKNMGKRFDEPPSYKDEEFDDSGEEGEQDHYAEQMKAEARDRKKRHAHEAVPEDDSEDEDSDYNPDAQGEEQSDKSEPDEEYDSDVKKSSSGGSSEDDSEGGGGDSDASSGKKKKKSRGKEGKTGASSSKAGKKRKKSESEEEEKPRGKKAKGKKGMPDPFETSKRRQRAKKDSGAPKKGQSAYMLWFQANREALKEPGMSVTDVAKKAGATWKGLTDKSEWEQKARDDRERYLREMKEYEASGKAAAAPSSKTTGKKKKTVTPVKSTGIKSKETISDTDDSDDDDDDKKKAGKEKDTKKSESEPEASSPSSGSSEESEGD